MCLCRLHNFCINERLRDKARSLSLGSHELAPPLAADAVEISAHGAIQLRRREGGHLAPEALLDGGEHHDDTVRKDLRQIERKARGNCPDGKLPRDIMHEIVVSKGLKRPEPNQWKNRERIN
jgi:hypothetical protein